MTDYPNDARSTGNKTNASALRLYSSADNLNDFPILKAFQEYVNEEQSKAQKRMTLLCVIFMLILLVVVGVFTVLLVRSNHDNSQLSGRLLEMALKAQSAPLLSTSSSDAVKSLTDSITQIQTKMSEQQIKLAQEQQALFEEKLRLITATKQDEARPQPPSPALRTSARKNKETEVRLKKEAARLKDERAQLEREKAELHKQQVELNRRKLYPEFYQKDKKEAPSKLVPQKKASPSSAANIAPIDYFDQYSDVAEESTDSATESKPDHIDYFSQYEQTGGAETSASTPRPSSRNETLKTKSPESPLPQARESKPKFENLTVHSPTGDSVDWQIPLD